MRSLEGGSDKKSVSSSAGILRAPSPRPRGAAWATHRTTYSYLGTIVAKKNQSVARGDVVGTVGPGHDASLPPNVQLSARRNGVYFDPLELYVGDGYADLVQLTG